MTLTIEKPVVEAGKPVTIEVRLVNTGMSRDFFNPYFKGLIAAPGQIALYDGNHNYLCDDKPWVSPSARGYSWDDWTFIPGGGSYIGFFSLLTPNYYRRPLPPGDYYLQIIYYKALIGLDPPWSDTDPDVEAKRNRLKDFEAHYDHSELFRSNPVKITITK
ncbi:MAG: hypothetical protein P4N59_00050 [Negativicutes bacterium]|nr:hypothetical protein [Negativicutes bacterium]